MRFKRMSEIYSRLVDHTVTNTNEVNDFSVGSAMRAIYEAVSIEIEQFYIMTRENVQEAIEAGVYSSFGFKRKAAQRAYGVVSLSFHNATQQTMVISRGTRFSSSLSEYAQMYETLEDYFIPKGSITAEVMVYCRVPGSMGNVPAEAIDMMQSPLSNLKDSLNLQPFQTGQDEEPLEELRSRFRSYIQSLSKATVPALEYGTRTVPEVAGVHIEEQTGTVIVYAHDRNGNLPDAVKAKIIEELHNYRPAGIPVRVEAVTRKNIDVDVTVTLKNKTAVTNRLRDRIESEIAKYLNNMQTSQSLVLSDLSSVIRYMDRQMIYDVHIASPQGNVVLSGSEIIRAGTIKVTLK